MKLSADLRDSPSQSIRSRIRERNQQEVACKFGFGSFEDYYRDRRRRGWTLDAIARESGHDRQWLRQARREYEPGPVLHHNSQIAERRHQQRAGELGFTDLDSYLRQRHLDEGKGTVEMGRELGVDGHGVRQLLKRRGILLQSDDLLRERALRDRRQIASGFGFASFEAYLADRRAKGWLITDIAREVGRSPGWVLYEPGTGSRIRPPDPPESLPPRRRLLPSLPGSLGLLSDGTPYYAPLGLLPYDRLTDKVQCHLCGQWFRSVGRHAWQAHGWLHQEYVDAFGLRQGRPLCTVSLSERIRAAMKALFRQSRKVRSYLAKGQAMLKDRELRRQWHSKGRRGLLERIRRRRELGHLFWGPREEVENARKLSRLRELGFTDLESYLRERYLLRWWTIGRIAAEGVGSEAWIKQRLTVLGLSVDTKQVRGKLAPEKAE